MTRPIAIASALWLLAGCNATKDAEDDTGDSGPGQVAGSVHCDPITADEVWTAANSPHQVICDLEIDGGVVTIEAGVEVHVDPGVRIRVGQGGEASGVVAQGTASDPVVFALTPLIDPTDEEGWGGLAFHVGAVQNQLSHVRIERGGANIDAALWVENAEVLLESVSVVDSRSVGLRLEADAALSEGSTALEITGSAGEAAWLESHVAHTLPAAGSSYTGNGEDVVIVGRGPAIEGDVTWANVGVPWVITRPFDVDGSADAPATLRIAPGASLLFEEGAGINVAANGGSSSLFIGEAGGDTVSLGARAEAQEPGLWDGIVASHGTLEVALHEVLIELGGDASTDGAALQVQGDVEVVLDGVSVSGSLGYGIYLRDGAWLSADSGDITVSGCEGWPVRVRADAAHTIPPEDYTGNTFDGVRVDGGDVAAVVEWEDLGVPYVITGDVHINGHLNETSILTIGPGTRFLMDSGASIRLANGGGESGLFIEGEAGDEVEMTALLADEDGFWDGISADRGVVPGSLSLTHTVLNWGGARTFDAMLKVVDTSVYVEEVTLSNSSSYGFQLGGSAVFEEGSRGLTLDSNYEDGELPAGRVHSLPADLRFVGETSGSGRTRGYHALFVNGTSDPEGELTWPALTEVDTDGDGVDDADAAYWILSSFYVTGTAEAPSVLTLEAGTQLWMGDNTAVYVSTDGGAGGLIADASGGDPIVFTAAEADVVGRWQGIKVWNHCLDDQVIFSNVSISYAGGTGDTLPDANLVLNGCDALLEDVLVDHSDTNGVLISGDPTIINSRFEDNDVCGIQVSSGDPSITGSTFRGNGGGEVCY